MLGNRLFLLAFVHYLSRRDIQSADEKVFIYDSVKEFQRRGADEFFRGSLHFQILRSMRVLGDLPAVAVDRYLALIVLVGNVVANRHHDLIGHEILAHEVERESVRHFVGDQPRLFNRIRLLQHLPRADALCLRLVCLDVCNRTRLPTPSVVDEQFSIDAE